MVLMHLDELLQPDRKEQSLDSHVYSMIFLKIKLHPQITSMEFVQQKMQFVKFGFLK